VRGLWVVVLRHVLLRLGGSRERGLRELLQQIRRGYLDWAGEAVCRYEFYKSLFSQLSFLLAEERSPIMSLFQNLLRFVSVPPSGLYTSHFHRIHTMP